MQSLTPADRVDAIKRAALDAAGGDVEAAFDALAMLALKQALMLRVHAGRGYGRLPPDVPSGWTPKARTAPL